MGLRRRVAKLEAAVPRDEEPSVYAGLGISELAALSDLVLKWRWSVRERRPFYAEYATLSAKAQRALAGVLPEVFGQLTLEAAQEMQAFFEAVEAMSEVEQEELWSQVEKMAAEEASERDYGSGQKRRGEVGKVT